VLLCGHGKPGGSKTRFSEVGRTAAVRGAAVAPRSTSGRSGAPGGSASAVGQSLGRTTEAGWCTGFETGRTRRAQSAFTSGRFTADRAWVETWAAGPGLRNQLVDFVARGPLDRAGMRGEVPPVASLADSAATGMELPASGGTGVGARRRQDPAVEAERWPEIKKKPGKRAVPSSSSTKAD
jgi:hypothetical protein